MRDLRVLDAFRDTSPEVIAYYGDAGDSTCGVFHIPSKTSGMTLTVIASVGDGWDHVSVSLPNRTPSWAEMEQVKRLFFRDDETAMQLHVPPAEHIDVCRTCLHLWRPLNVPVPRPDRSLVA